MASIDNSQHAGAFPLPHLFGVHGNMGSEPAVFSSYSGIFSFFSACVDSPPLFYPFKTIIKKKIVFNTSPLEGFLAVFSIYIILYLISLSASYPRPPSDYNL